MSAATIGQQRADFTPVARSAPPERGLWRLAQALCMAALITAGLALIDSREWVTAYSSQSVWTKPLKFQLAMALHLGTLAWAIAWLRKRGIVPPGLRAWLALLMVTVLFEAIYITLQGARSTASHFNRTTPWETAAGWFMAAGAQVLVSVAGWIGIVALWRLATQRSRPGQRPLDAHDRPVLLAIGLGFVAAFALSGWTGGLMGASQGPLPEAPLVALAQSSPISIPLAGWRLDVGDLRPAHFLGVHALQAVPLLAVLSHRLSPTARVWWVAVGALAWVGACLGAVWWGSGGWQTWVSAA